MFLNVAQGATDGFRERAGSQPSWQGPRQSPPPQALSSDLPLSLGHVLRPDTPQPQSNPGIFQIPSSPNTSLPGPHAGARTPHPCICWVTSRLLLSLPPSQHQSSP